MAGASGSASGGGGGSDAQDFAKVTLLGNPSVGKTCLMKKFVYSKWDPSYRVTLGADFGTKEVQLPGGKTVTAQVWDTAGQGERLRAIHWFYKRLAGPMHHFVLLPSCLVFASQRDSTR